MSRPLFHFFRRHDRFQVALIQEDNGFPVFYEVHDLMIILIQLSRSIHDVDDQIGLLCLFHRAGDTDLFDHILRVPDPGRIHNI